MSPIGIVTTSAFTYVVHSLNTSLLGMCSQLKFHRLAAPVMTINFSVAGFPHIRHLSSCCPHRAIPSEGRAWGRDTVSCCEPYIHSKTKPNQRKPSRATSATASMKIKPERVCEQKMANKSLTWWSGNGSKKPEMFPPTGLMKPCSLAPLPSPEMAMSLDIRKGLDWKK